ncbi:uncharacterized protein CLUP02_13434 [Colletotrichum lupini]|uniref:Uncharacterized protein n=1 Tax=Colletotrichum lupini TaxID=145971 RepID=A0A9Q8T2E4_9PEZI|nr:uncharacterized protein CLUP02_13434 [Colletotrichum lupini]UQC87913.1 hypothetical protein CLUP02_13434 [Colletotrichum lupini]
MFLTPASTQTQLNLSDWRHLRSFHPGSRVPRSVISASRPPVTAGLSRWNSTRRPIANPSRAGLSSVQGLEGTGPGTPLDPELPGRTRVLDIAWAHIYQPAADLTFICRTSVTATSCRIRIDTVTALEFSLNGHDGALLLISFDSKLVDQLVLEAMSLSFWFDLLFQANAKKRTLAPTIAAYLNYFMLMGLASGMTDSYFMAGQQKKALWRNNILSKSKHLDVQG